VKEALDEIDRYEVPRRVERYEMMYCTGRIESATTRDNAMEILRNHLQKHYSLYNNPPTMSIYQLELPLK